MNWEILIVEDCEEDTIEGEIDLLLLRRPENESRRDGDGFSGFGLRRGHILLIEQLKRDLQRAKLALC